MKTRYTVDAIENGKTYTIGRKVITDYDYDVLDNDTGEIICTCANRGNAEMICNSLNAQ